MSDYVPTIDDLRVKLCFICREEETYDNIENPPRKWTHPCQCTLIAHEECLLEWIKAAQTKTTTTAAENAMKCPQCAVKYQLESDLPLGMKVMNEALIKWNVSLGTIGKWLTAAIPVGLVTGVGIGTHYVLTRYGAYAVKEFFGEELFNALLTSDPNKWSWTALINLPLIPIGLMSYRFSSTYNIFPAISTLLEWPDFQRHHSYNNLGQSDFLSWPPSPFTVGFVVLPLTRYLYRKCLSRITGWVLDTSPQRGLNAAIEGDEDDRLLVIRLRHAQGNNGGGGGGARDAEDGNHNPDNGEASIRIYASPLGRKIGGALLIPFVAKRMGNLLLCISKYSELLRRFLAVRRPLSVRSLKSQVGKGEVTWRLVLRALWGGGGTWAEFDPIWWRNTIGFGIFVVAKDAIHLLNLYLVKKEFETRRVKNRSFRGVDVSGLDLLPRELR